MLRSEMKTAAHSLRHTSAALVNGDEWTARILLVELNLVADADTTEELLPCILPARQMGRASKAECQAILAAKAKALSNVADLPLSLHEKFSRAGLSKPVNCSQ